MPGKKVKSSEKEGDNPFLFYLRLYFAEIQNKLRWPVLIRNSILICFIDRGHSYAV